MRRRDYFFKLAHALFDTCDVLCFEILNIKAMKMMWGKIVSDYGFSTFIEILHYVAHKRGKQVLLIERWYPSYKTCSCCDNMKANLPLSERVFEYTHCGMVLHRDHNAARNIKRVGASTLHEAA